MGSLRGAGAPARNAARKGRLWRLYGFVPREVCRGTDTAHDASPGRWHYDHRHGTIAAEQSALRTSAAESAGSHEQGQHQSRDASTGTHYSPERRRTDAAPRCGTQTLRRSGRDHDPMMAEGCAAALFPRPALLPIPSRRNDAPSARTPQSRSSVDCRARAIARSSHPRGRVVSSCPLLSCDFGCNVE
jgi:hypothetical protein